MTGEVQTQVNNIVETLKNFSRSEADEDDIVFALIDELQKDEHSDLFDSFMEFADIIDRVNQAL